MCEHGILEADNKWGRHNRLTKVLNTSFWSEVLTNSTSAKCEQGVKSVQMQVSPSPTSVI